MPTPAFTCQTASGRLKAFNIWLAFALGFSTFLPIGITYLATLLLTAGVLLAHHDWQERKALLKPWGWGGLLCLFLAWPWLLALTGVWHPETDTRLFHLARVVWIVTLGLVLTNAERRMALLGFLLGAFWAAAVVALHHVWGLPEWTVWRSLLEVRGNSGSQKMILMAMAAGVSLWLGVRATTDGRSRLFYIGAAVLFTAVVSLHGISRNAHLLLAILPVMVVVYRWRRWQPLTLGLLATMLVGLAVWHSTPNIQPRFEVAVSELRALATEGNYSSSVGVRVRMWQEAWQGFVSDPISGTGVGSWEPIWRNAAVEFPAMAGINNPHNDYALFAMETGLPGLLLLLAIPVGLAVRNWKSHSTLGGVGLLAVVTVLVSTSVNAPWRDAGLGMSMLWLMAAMTDFQSRSSHDASNP